MVGYPLSCYGWSRVWVTTRERLHCRRRLRRNLARFLSFRSAATTLCESSYLGGQYQLRVRTERQTATDLCSTLAVGAVADVRARDCVLPAKPLRVPARL